MQPALLWDKLDGNRVKCRTCQWYCRINDGHYGVCRMYRNEAGQLFNLNYARISSMAVDPIEKKPLYHFYPGSKVFSLGTWGCNFHCRGCQNWEIACPETDDGLLRSRRLLPEQAVMMALEADCGGIAWTYNEPSIWLEYTLETARIAKKQGLYTVYVTNGYASAEQLEAIGPYLDAWRVDIKGFSDAAYREIGGIPHFEGILRIAERAARDWAMHLEVVTNIIPGINDDDKQLSGIAGWIARELGPLTPWHVTRFYPRRQMDNHEATPPATLERARRLGRAAGLEFVYLGNLPGNEYSNTVCYHCGREVVRRSGFSAVATGLDGARCRYCGAELNFRR